LIKLQKNIEKYHIYIMNRERWRRIGSEYPDYRVSNFGNVENHKQDMIIYFE